MKFEDFYNRLITENSKPRSYSCLMLDCSEFKKGLKAIQQQIDKDDLYDEEGFGMEKDPHITVLYGIHEQDPTLVKKELRLSPITYTLTKLSLFENDKYDVLKCSVKSKDLHKLNKECCDVLDFTNDYPDYIPHLTVAYLNPGMGKKYIKFKSDKFGEDYVANKFIFSDKDSNKTKWSIS